MKFEEVTFYPAAVEGKTFKEFCEHEKHYKLSKEKMKEVYDLLKGNAPKVDFKFDTPVEIEVEKPAGEDNKL